MASYLRPRRGKRATAIAQNIVLKRGEVFFECPDAGVGTGIGRIKVGDGITAYKDLPYFMSLDAVEIDVDDSKVIFTEATSTDNSVLLNAISSGSSIKVIVSNVKKLLRNLVDGVTKLNNDLGNFSKSDHTHNYSDIVGLSTNYAPSNHNHNDIYLTESEVTQLLATKVDSDKITYTTEDPGENVSSSLKEGTLICIYEIEEETSTVSTDEEEVES